VKGLASHSRVSEPIAKQAPFGEKHAIQIGEEASSQERFGFMYSKGNQFFVLLSHWSEAYASTMDLIGLQTGGILFVLSAEDRNDE